MPALDGGEERARRLRALPEHGAGVGIDVDAAIPAERELDGGGSARPDDDAGRPRAAACRGGVEHLAQATGRAVGGSADRPQAAIDELQELSLEGERHSGRRHREDRGTGDDADAEVRPEEDSSCHGGMMTGPPEESLKGPGLGRAPPSDIRIAGAGLSGDLQLPERPSPLEGSMRILLVEDDRDVAEYIRRQLEEEGHAVSVCHDGAAGLRAAERSAFDIVVLDVMLPFMDGLEVTRRLRRQHVQTPILLLTARDAPEEIVRGLDSGADDYLTKPFSFDVLLARIRVRTRAAAQGQSLRYADLVLDLGTREASRGGRSDRAHANGVRDPGVPDAGVGTRRAARRPDRGGVGRARRHLQQPRGLHPASCAARSIARDRPSSSTRSGGSATASGASEC